MSFLEPSRCNLYHVATFHRAAGRTMTYTIIEMRRQMKICFANLILTLFLSSTFCIYPHSGFKVAVLLRPLKQILIDWLIEWSNLPTLSVTSEWCWTSWCASTYRQHKSSREIKRLTHFAKHPSSVSHERNLVTKKIIFTSKVHKCVYYTDSVGIINDHNILFLFTVFSLCL